MWPQLLTTIALFPLLYAFICLVARAEHYGLNPPRIPRYRALALRLLVVYSIISMLFLPIGIHPIYPVLVLGLLPVLCVFLEPAGLVAHPVLLLYHWIAWGGAASADNQSHRQASSQQQHATTQAESQMIGRVGIATTALRPMGTVTIGEEVYEARSQISLIKAGESIRVVSQQGQELVVTTVDSH